MPIIIEVNDFKIAEFAKMRALSLIFPFSLTVHIWWNVRGHRLTEIPVMHSWHIHTTRRHGFTSIFSFTILFHLQFNNIMNKIQKKRKEKRKNLYRKRMQDILYFNIIGDFRRFPISRSINSYFFRIITTSG